MKSNKPAKVKQIIAAVMVSLLLSISLGAPAFASNQTIQKKAEIIDGTSSAQNADTPPETGAAESAVSDPAPATSATQEAATGQAPETAASATGTSAENAVPITTIEELQRIGSERYPLDGTYALMNDIDGAGAVFTPIGSAEEPFSGKFLGNGYSISNIVIESEERTGLFDYFTGNISSVNLKDIKVNTKNRQSILFNVVSGEAEVSDIFIEGTLEKPEKPEENPIEASGGLAVQVESAKKIKNVQVYVLMQNQGKMDGALVGSNSAPAEVYEDCVWSNAYGQDKAFGVDSEVNKSEGAYLIKPDPSYVTLETGGRQAQVSANRETADKFDLEFKEWSFQNIILDGTDGKDGSATVKSKEETGVEDITAVYEKQWEDGTKTQVRFLTPVIVSQNVTEEKALEPIDPVFPTQIEEIKKLDGAASAHDEINITQNPESAVGNEGDSVTFRVEAQGEGLSYQWQVSADGGQTWMNIEGANGREYTFTATQADDGKQFRCAVSR